MRRRGHWLARSAFAFAVFLVVVAAVGPYVWQLITSVKPSLEIASLPPVLPSKPVFVHYVSVFAGRPFARIILNSAVVASLTTIFSLLVGGPAAYSIAKMRSGWKNPVLVLVLSVSMFPPIAAVSPLYIFIRALGLRDTYPALIIPYSTFALPLTIWILTNFFREIPDDLSRAALVDGCSHFEVFYKIMVPIAAPGVFTAAILVFIFSWNEFLFALTFTTTETSRTIPVGIALFPGIHEIPWGEIAAATIIVTTPLVALVFIFQKRIIPGLSAGSVKG